MNRKLILTATTVLLAATAAFGESISFGSSPVTAGESWNDTAAFESKVTLGSIEKETRVARTKETIVRNVSGNGSIDEAEVAYSSATRNGAPMPVEGKRYAVSASGNSIEVSYAAGGAPPEDEAAFVRSDNAHFRQFRAYEKIFGGQTFAIGESVPVHGNNAQDLVNASGEVEVRALALTLRSVSGSGDARTATFDVSMTLDSRAKQGKGKKVDAPGGGMTLTLNGTLEVRVHDGRPMLLDVGGPLSVSVKKPSNAVIASGNGSASFRIAYDGF